MSRPLPVLLAVLALAAGCAAPTAAREPVAERIDLRGARLVVGSGRGAGQRTLGALAVRVLRVAGARVVHRAGLEGRDGVRGRLESGRVDVAWQYTGTVWDRHLGHGRPVRDEQGQYRAVRQADLRRHGIRWLEPASAQRIRTLAFGPRAAGRFGARTLSELARLPRDDLIVCLRATARPGEGLRGLERRYGFRFRGARVREMEPGAIYEATASGGCHLGQVVTTDPRIRTRRLTVLDDDRHFFGPSNLSLTVREATYDAYAREFGALSDALSPLLTTDTVVALNAQVEIKGHPPGAVAARFMTETGLVGR
ncbi:MAG: hypothetical protein KY434_01335 [Actinobacteria bacterium]|nr:hypothetical protein [Actinomycetota bacterium]